ncbi:helix-turn-helix domain-containing protein [Streptomyces sp. NBC_00654]|uniref:winged helix-turn-helix domain-containing protein n=1 Tax=Streptomyces sp. NBC_00654 TaxID=2975799 RepID=UPI0022572CF5|nr:helix-turn-helix domain-containing protein [Streptomyces sp. NBC_00654]MCX4967320.1 helix-turn-helix domain-containing protein [Streptomyces sp. NBC_00654]
MADDADAIAVVREVDDVETLKALSDPLRLAILRTMMCEVRASHRVKDIARLLDQPTTRLYRHIKVLEAAGLIKVAQTRMVSGIQESQYRVAQFALRLSRDLLAAPGNAGELADAFAATLNDFRDRLVRDIISGRFQPEPEAAEEPDPLGPMVVALDRRLTPERATEFRSRLSALMEEFNRPDDEENAVVPVEFLLLFWAPKEPTEESP